MVCWAKFHCLKLFKKFDNSENWLIDHCFLPDIFLKSGVLVLGTRCMVIYFSKLGHIIAHFITILQFNYSLHVIIVTCIFIVIPRHSRLLTSRTGFIFRQSHFLFLSPETSKFSQILANSPAEKCAKFFHKPCTKTV